MTPLTPFITRLGAHLVVSGGSFRIFFFGINGVPRSEEIQELDIYTVLRLRSASVGPNISLGVSKHLPPTHPHTWGCEQWKRAPGCLGYIGIGIILPSYMGIIISHYKDPYSTTSIMESKRVFFMAHVWLLPPKTLPKKTFHLNRGYDWKTRAGMVLSFSQGQPSKCWEMMNV